VPFVVGENVGPFTITRQLGVGGMATVWKAYHPALDRYVAIKVLHPSFKEDPQFTERFQREARIVAKLTHPHIVPVYDFSEHEGMSYLVMRYIDGRTLKAVLREGPLSPEQVMGILEPACQALAYAHDQGVLHRDIKPSNFIITPEGEVFLTDFGLARIAESTDSTLSRDTLIGTPQYISPEQVRGERLDARTDVYSLGVVLFEMLTGRVPYDADTPYAVIHDHVFAPLPMPRDFNPGLSEPVERVVLKALAKSRDDRYQNVREMISALEAAQRAEGLGTKVEEAPVPVEAGGVAVTDEALAPLEEGEGGDEFSPQTVEPESVDRTPAKPSWWSRRLVAVVAVLAVLIGLCLCGSVTLAALRRSGEDRVWREPQSSVIAMPEDASAHVELARRYLQQGNVEQAIAEYEVALRLDPQLVEAYVDLGNLYLREGNPELALESYQKALDIDPSQIKAHLGMGDAYLLLGQYDVAAYHYQIVIEHDPDVAGPHGKLGVCLVLSGDLEQGRTECELALRLDAQAPEGHFCRGLYLAQTGDTEGARREFEKVVATAPGFLAELARRQLDRLD